MWFRNELSSLAEVSLYLFRRHGRWYVHHCLGRPVFRLQVGMYSGANFAMCVSCVLNKWYFHYNPQQFNLNYINLVHLFYVSFSTSLANDLKISSPMSHCFLKAVFRRVRKISESNYWLRQVCRLSVCPSAWHNSALTTRKFWFSFSMIRITGTFREDQYKFTAVSCGILLRVRNVSKAVQKIKTHMLRSITSPPPEIRAAGEIMWKNVVQPDRPQMRTKYGACSLHAG